VRFPSRTAHRRRLPALVFVAAFLAAAFLTAPPLAAYRRHLNQDDVRDAYFFGQVHDLRVAHFFDSYEKHVPLPAKPPGPYVTAIGVRTPYSAAVLRSYLRGNSYTAQRAWKDFSARANLLEVVVWVQYLIAAPRTEPLRHLFTVKLISEDHVVSYQATAIYPRCYGDGDSGGALCGAEMHFDYDVDQVSSAPVRIEVTDRDDRTVSAEFDLASLR
jgi:hypothetical protein